MVGVRAASAVVSAVGHFISSLRSWDSDFGPAGGTVSSAVRSGHPLVMPTRRSLPALGIGAMTGGTVANLPYLAIE